MITLIIVCCQNDFITGTESVKGAKTILDEIKNFIKSHKKEIGSIIFVIDWHPYNHMSFKKYGGLYQHHCVQYTPGACIEPKLLKYVQSLDIDYQVCQKGCIEEVDEEGAFNEIEFVSDELGQRYYFDSLITVDADSTLVVCGISGDRSVKATIENLLKENIDVKIFSKGIVSSDGGSSFSEFVKENKLKKIT